MANIHDIKTAQVRRPADQSVARPATAQVILFPGVRYERATGSLQTPVADQCTRRRERDLMEIAD